MKPLLILTLLSLNSFAFAQSTLKDVMKIMKTELRTVSRNVKAQDLGEATSISAQNLSNAISLGVDFVPEKIQSLGDEERQKLTLKFKGLMNRILGLSQELNFEILDQDALEAKVKIDAILEIRGEGHDIFN